MTIIDIIKSDKGYVSRYEDMPEDLQIKAKNLCLEYNSLKADDDEKKSEVLKKLLGTYNPLAFIESGFRCDYGFNIHLVELLQQVFLAK